MTKIHPKTQAKLESVLAMTNGTFRVTDPGYAVLEKVLRSGWSVDGLSNGAVIADVRIVQAVHVADDFIGIEIHDGVQNQNLRLTYITVQNLTNIIEALRLKKKHKKMVTALETSGTLSFTRMDLNEISMKIRALGCKEF